MVEIYRSGKKLLTCTRGNDPVASLGTMPPAGASLLYMGRSESLWCSVAIFPGTDLSSYRYSWMVLFSCTGLFTDFFPWAVTPGTDLGCALS